MGAGSSERVPLLLVLVLHLADERALAWAAIDQRHQRIDEVRVEAVDIIYVTQRIARRWGSRAVIFRDAP